jgi:hypothetical protein
MLVISFYEILNLFIYYIALLRAHVPFIYCLRISGKDTG